MPTNVTSSFTDSTSSDAIQSFFNRRLLMRATYDHFGMMLATAKPLALRQGKNMIFRRFARHTAQTTALTEAVTPTPLSKSKTDVAIAISLYGGYMVNSDVLDLTQPEGLLDDVDQLAQNMGETMDVLHLREWANGTNITYANGAGETSVNTLSVYEDWDKALRNLVNNKAKRTTPKIAPSQQIGTGSIMPGYWCLLSNSLFYDIRAGSTFAGKFFLPSNYGNSAAITGEGGALDVGIRLLPIPDADALLGELIVEGGGATGGDAAVIAETSNVADVHYGVIIGQEAMGTVSLGGKGQGGIIRKGLGTAGTDDPLEQRCTIGWKKFNGRGLFNQAFVQTVKAATAL